MYFKINRDNLSSQQPSNFNHINYSQSDQRLLYDRQRQKNVNHYGREKQNSVRDTNLVKLSPRYEEGNQRFVKSISSNQQTTHPRTSTDNLHSHRLESIVLELQKTLDQQQYEIETLTDESTHFMNLCEDQKEVLINLNIEGMRSQYEQQIKQLLDQRHKVSEIISQLQEDYNQVYCKEQAELTAMRSRNDEISRKIEMELEKKKCMISLLASKDNQLLNLQIDYRQSQERLDQLRNIQRKLTIALRELEALHHRKPHLKGVSLKEEQIIREEVERIAFESPIIKSSIKGNNSKSKSRSNKKYQFEFVPQE